MAWSFAACGQLPGHLSLFWPSGDDTSSGSALAKQYTKRRGPSVLRRPLLKRTLGCPRSAALRTVGNDAKSERLNRTRKPNFQRILRQRLPKARTDPPALSFKQGALHERRGCHAAVVQTRNMMRPIYLYMYIYMYIYKSFSLKGILTVGGPLLYRPDIQ